MDDDENALAALGYRRQVLAQGAGALWRLTDASGASTTGAAASDRSARREAVFAAFALGVMTRIRARR